MNILQSLKNAKFLARIFARKPKFLARTIANYVRATVLGQHRLRFMDIAVSYDCNLACTHCSALPMKQGGEEPLTVEEYAKLSVQLRRAGCVLFHFTGGEPLLRKDLEQIIQAFDPKSCGISIQSNGFPATRKRLESLRGAGVDIFCVSLDSGIPEEHDRFRKCEGSYNKAIETLALAAEVGFITSASTCVSHDNLYSEGFHRVIALTRDMGIDCQFNLAVPTGHWRDNQNVVLTEQDKTEVRRLLAANPHCRLDLFHNWSKVGCGTIKEKLYLSAYGDVMPCPFIQISFGNLRRETIGKVRSNAFEVEEFRSYWPECLAAEAHDFMEQIVAFSDGTQQTPVKFDSARWNLAHKNVAALDGKK